MSSLSIQSSFASNAYMKQVSGVSSKNIAGNSSEISKIQSLSNNNNNVSRVPASEDAVKVSLSSAATAYQSITT